MTDLRLVYVWWEDSTNYDGWSQRPQWGSISSGVQSVGFVVHEDAEHLVLAPHYVAGEDEQGAGVMAIPQVAIQCVRDMAKPKRSVNVTKVATVALKRGATIPKKRGR